MSATRKSNSLSSLSTRESGNALVEFALVAMIMVTIVCALIDFSRAIYQKQVLAHLSREGSNLASRGTSLTDAAQAVVNGSTPLDLGGANGRVIVSQVQNNLGSKGTSVCQVMDQVTLGGLTSATSKIGTKRGNTTPGDKTSNPATLPQPCTNSNTTSFPQPNLSVYTTEVFYKYQPVTPIGTLIGAAIPSTLYDAAYF